MDRLDQLLRNEMSRSLERIAGSCPEGTLAAISAEHPRLRRRLDEAEARLAGFRAELLERYAAWQAGLAELENLWALAMLKRDEPKAADVFRSAA